MQRWPALALVGLLLGACVPVAATTAAPMSDEREADAVLDVVYRALLVVAEPGGKETVCLVVRRTVDGKEQMGDPSAEHLARLQKENPNVRPGSACEGGGGPPVASATPGGPEPLVVDIGPVEWTGKDSAKTAGGFSRGGYTTTEFRYELARSASGWTITKTSRGPVI